MNKNVTKRRSRELVTSDDDQCVSCRLSFEISLLMNESTETQLRHRRKEACASYAADPRMRRFLPIWEAMPPEAMSGDETDHDNGRLRYAITQLDWRNPDALEWFRTFDHLHLSTRFGTDDRPTPGQFPHPRVNSQRMEHRARPVKGLPRNFYDAEWLQTLDQFEYNALDIRPEVDLTFSADILRCAC